MRKRRRRPRCAICRGPVPDLRPGNYPRPVCERCDSRAVNKRGSRPRWYSREDDGDNPVYIDGIRCLRHYRFGGYITMRDD